VKRFYEVGLEAGGRDNGAPGERKYHPGYYAAFLFDPDGHNVEAVFHGPSKRSAESVAITID
jgi:lactoylglutathione lyase